MIKTDIRNQPAYSVAEAARYLKVAPATLRSWVAGRPYPKGAGTAHSSPLIRPARNPPPTLSFWNLIEAHVLRSLRTDHSVKMDALRRLFNEHLARVEWDEWKFPVRLFPVTSSDVISSARSIAIDAHVAFGRPVLAQKGIATGAIVERMDAGESVTDLAEDYDLSTEEIMEAVLYERAA